MVHVPYIGMIFFQMFYSLAPDGVARELLVRTIYVHNFVLSCINDDANKANIIYIYIRQAPYEYNFQIYNTCSSINIIFKCYGACTLHRNDIFSNVLFIGARRGGARVAGQDYICT
mmetsp:Transcript_41112/g.109869  ORF Transcript_41112/g.109869 Transcript_41112/m.109869 type:complete len:116 (+) Transcript_41112:90-437(+)